MRSICDQGGVEDFVASDAILSRDESDPAGDIAAKVVEEVFQRFAPSLTMLAGVFATASAALFRPNTWSIAFLLPLNLPDDLALGVQDFVPTATEVFADAVCIMCPDAEAPFVAADEVGVPVGDPQVVDDFPVVEFGFALDANVSVS